MNKQKRIMVDMSATILHHGHTRLLKRAKQFGGLVVVALTSDQEIRKAKGYQPELNFNQRKEILLALKNVDEVVESPFSISEEFLKTHNIDLLLHGSDNNNQIPENKLVIVERTKDISSSDMRNLALSAIVSTNNQKKPMFTPGPGCLLPENLIGMRPAFGRGDQDYDNSEKYVLNALKKLSGHKHITRLQGSATLALEISITNFVAGKVLVIDSGYYSQRLNVLAQLAKTRKKEISQIQIVNINEIEKHQGKFDWILAAYTETAQGYKNDLKSIKDLSTRTQAKLLLDATASIALENNHDLADVIAYSSCKGLFGITGSAFIAYNDTNFVKENSFYLDINTHIEKKITGPYHQICGLEKVLPKIEKIKQAVKESKEEFVAKFTKYLAYSQQHQPLIATKISCELSYKKGIFYTPRGKPQGSVVCHLGDTFIRLLSDKKINFYDSIEKTTEKSKEI
jgi:cytidyltransferase-like protein